MASSKEYAYYLRGQNIAVVQKDYELDGGQTLEQPGLNAVGRSGTHVWKSPKDAVTDGIEIEYTYIPDIVDEASDLDMPRYLANAIVCYLKAKLAEDGGDLQAREIYMADFRKIIEKHESSRVWAGRMVMPGPNAIR